MDKQTLGYFIHEATTLSRVSFPVRQFVCMTLIDQWHMSFLEAAQLLNKAGNYLYEHAQYTEAEPFYRRALAIHEKQLGADHPDTANSLNNLALLYQSQGNYQQAEPLYQRALAIYEKQLGADHPDTATSLNNLAAFYRSQGNYQQAEPLYQRALAIYEKQLGTNHPNTKTVQKNYTDLLQKTKDNREQQS